MNISEVAKLTGLTPKSIRLYEDKGIFTPPGRGINGYRIYNQSHIEDLRLIARAKRAGFSLDECKLLLSFAHDPHRKSALVKDEARKKLAQVKAKIEELRLIEVHLEQWIAECPGDEHSQCPIIDELQGNDSE
ncbi:HTH-type transcriptional regulator CueR [Vibrio aerogenes CECT 7868]|uniref:HTH-type transcriptional regulator CueR n=1 Tax=Vibrio aerogenes CECT 7868 TaxID=1216006 RepID=A0A1M5Z0F6_9VIBR|nr:Cu(I)-responsive transcriptional regulator [Vibrio aerogenes]SHI17711.1 HTH-type transcriptional regulator CueR [Vibrio aerogenes CECT 7868]